MFFSPERLTRWTSSRFLGPVTVALAVLVLAVNEVGYQSVQRIGAQSEVVLGARLAADKVRQLIQRMESAKRGYLLTGRPAYLEPYDEMARQLEPLLAEIRQLAETYPAQRQPLQKLADLVKEKDSEMAEVLRRFQAGDRDAVMDLLLTDFGRESMVRINALADEILVEEGVAYNHAGRLRGQVLFWSRLGIAALVLLCVAAVLTVLQLGRERERERALHLKLLGAERDKLEGEVARRTHELMDLAQHLQRVREDERSHLARELHDELGGLLTAAKLDVARVRKRVDGSGPEVAERIQHLNQTLDTGIALKRRIIEDLRPSSLSNLGLQRTLEIQCSEFAQRSEIRIEADIADLELDPERALAVYRLVQEALTNVAKYAEATQVRVVLQRFGDRAQVLVEDNGQGFDPAQLRPGTHGLAGMRFRMRSCGGDLKLRSAPGMGTTVEATVPL